MRVVFLNPAGILGGGERSLLDLMASLRQAESAIELYLIVNEEGPLTEEARKLGVSTLVLSFPASLESMGDSQAPAWPAVRFWRAVRSLLPSFRYAHELRRLLVTLEPDVIHSNGIKFHLLACMAGQPPAPLICHIRDFLGQRPLATHALRWASRYMRAAVAISRAVADDARRVLPRVAIEVIYNAVDTNTFAPGEAHGDWLDAQAGLPAAPSGTVRVGLLATFARWKGQDVFLRAAAEVMKSPPRTPLRFYLIGGPVYQTHGSQFSTDELQALARNLGVSIGFLGFQREPAPVYRALDIIVHASTKPEPFGRTIVEGMACARPVIVAQAGGAAELFTHGKDAVGVPPADPSTLATAIRRLAEAPEERCRIGQNARQTTLKRFARERLGVEMLALYREILCRNDARARGRGIGDR